MAAPHVTGLALYLISQLATRGAIDSHFYCTPTSAYDGAAGAKLSRMYCNFSMFYLRYFEFSLNLATAMYGNYALAQSPWYDDCNMVKIRGIYSYYITRT